MDRFRTNRFASESNETKNMWLEDPAKNITTGMVAVMAGFLIIAAEIKP